MLQHSKTCPGSSSRSASWEIQVGMWIRLVARPTKASERTRRWGESLWTVDVQLRQQCSEGDRIRLVSYCFHCPLGSVGPLWTWQCRLSVFAVPPASFPLPPLNPGFSSRLHPCVLLFFPRRKETKAGGWFRRRIWRGEKESCLSWGGFEKNHNMCLVGRISLLTGFDMMDFWKRWQACERSLLRTLLQSLCDGFRQGGRPMLKR